MPSRRALVRALWLLDRSYLPLRERLDLEWEILCILARWRSIGTSSTKASSRTLSAT
jgi:hypothetical protein